MMVNTVSVRQFDGYLETFEATEVRFGSDLLWMRLAPDKDGNVSNRHIPMRQVRWFSLSNESHEITQNDNSSTNNDMDELLRFAYALADTGVPVNQLETFVQKYITDSK